MRTRSNKRKPKLTVLRYCQLKLGVHRGSVAASRIAMWAIATLELGHMPTTVEYADLWAVDERTGWRHRALVHEALGDEWQPIVQEVADYAEKRLERRSLRDVREVAVMAW